MYFETYSFFVPLFAWFYITICTKSEILSTAHHTLPALSVADSTRRCHPAVPPASKYLMKPCRLQSPMDHRATEICGCAYNKKRKIFLYFYDMI